MDTRVMQLVAVIDRQIGEEKRSFHTRVGFAFENTDGSWTLRFDYLPARMDDTTLHMRALKDGAGAAG